MKGSVLGRGDFRGEEFSCKAFLIIAFSECIRSVKGKIIEKSRLLQSIALRRMLCHSQTMVITIQQQQNYHSPLSGHDLPWITCKCNTVVCSMFQLKKRIQAPTAVEIALIQ